MQDELLELIEKLLGVTEPYVPYADDVPVEDRDEWHRISARVADLRDGEDV